MKSIGIHKVVAKFMCDRKTKKMYLFELNMAGQALREQDVYMPLHPDGWYDFNLNWRDVFLRGERGVILLKDHDYLLREIIRDDPIGINFGGVEWGKRLACAYDRHKSYTPVDCGAREIIKELESGLSEAERQLEKLQAAADKYRANIAAVKTVLQK